MLLSRVQELIIQHLGIDPTNEHPCAPKLVTISASQKHAVEPAQDLVFRERSALLFRPGQSAILAEILGMGKSQMIYILSRLASDFVNKNGEVIRNKFFSNHAIILYNVPRRNVCALCAALNHDGVALQLIRDHVILDRVRSRKLSTYDVEKGVESYAFMGTPKENRRRYLFEEAVDADPTVLHVDRELASKVRKPKRKRRRKK